MTSEAGRSFSAGTPDSNYTSSTRGNGGPTSSGGASGIDSARDAIAGAATQAGTKVVAGINSQKAKAADGLGGVAQALRQSSDNLRSKDPSTSFPDYVSSAADQVERLSGYLRENTVSDMVNGVEQFARRQPAIFIGSVFMLGLVAARFLKSSASSRSDSGQLGRMAQGGRDSRETNYVDTRTSAGYWRDQGNSLATDPSAFGGSSDSRTF